MPYPYSITTRTPGETIDATKYNADHQAHVDHNIPADINDYSADTTQMRTATDPGAVGAESLAVTLAGELERIRYVLAQFIGGAWWYDLANRFLTSIKGISGTTTQAKNLRGSVTFAAATTASVNFAVAETNATYFVAISANANKTFWVTTKLTTGFIVNASSSSSDTVDWILIR
jgi:hypothetical protein